MKLASRRRGGALRGAALAALALALGAPGAAAELPAELAYELVSPLEPRGFGYTRAWLFPDGDRAVIGSEQNDVNAIYPAHRGDERWTATRRPLTPPNGSPLVASNTTAVSQDGTRVLVHVARPGTILQNRLALSEPDGSWKVVGNAIRHVDGTPDLSRLVVNAMWGAGDDEERFPGLPGRETGVFLWEDDGSPDGRATAIGADAPRLAACGAEVPDEHRFRTLERSGVSPDARRVVLTSRAGCVDPGDGATPLARHVFVWHDGVTTDVSAPLAGPDGDASFVGSSADLGAVFFRTRLALQSDDGNGADDVYRWDAATGARTRLTGAVTDGGEETLTSAMPSGDGSRLWFSTRDADGVDSLWVVARGGAPRPIASAIEDDLGQLAFDLRGDAQGSNSRGFPAQTTPDGETLVFTTQAVIDGEGGLPPDASTGEPGQLFRATAGGDVDCVSCFDDGSPVETLRAGGQVDSLAAMNRVLSDDGDWIAFQTPAALDDGDVNELSDVYVWHDDRRWLISAGARGIRADLANVSARGDVLFKTYAQLLPWIEHDHLKVYVARVGGGQPAPTDPREGCAGDGCQGPPASRVPAPGNASEGFAGPGDVDAAAPPFAADPKLTVANLTAAGKRRLAAGRAVTLRVRAGVAGRVSATARFKRGSGWRAGGSAARRMQAPGTARLTLRLNRAARARLARRGALRVRIELAHTRIARSRRLAFVLRTPAPAPARRAVRATAADAQDPPFGVVDGSFRVTQSTTQAGAHPDLNVRFEYTSKLDTHPVVGMEMPRPIEIPRNVVVDLPPGLVGDPTAVPRCSAVDFVNASCSPDTQVGTVEVSVFFLPWAERAAIYNLVPSQGSPAEFGFSVFTLPFHMLVDVRDGDHGIRTTIANLPSQGPLVWNDLTLWGDPSDPEHDPFRSGPLSGEVQPRPFMTNAATCDGPSSVRLATDTYEHPGRFVEATTSLPTLTGCEQQRFAARATARPDTARAGAPAGYEIALDVPQDRTVDGLATPPVKDVVVRLPAGTVVSPSTSDGLATCSAAAMRLGSSERPACPPGSKIGTVAIDTPLLSRPMTGSVFLLDQTPDRLLRMVLVAEEAGVRLKLTGEIDLDPASGQITATFANNPQLPFERLKVSLKGGPRAPLANPRQCGPATTTTTLVPWGGGAPVTATDAFEVSCDGAPAGFTPGFSAGSASTQAGAASAFALTFSRDDADDLLRAIDVELPAGVLPRLGRMPLCGDAQAAAGTCGEESRIGSVTTAAGPGELPFQLPGRVHVTRSYKGAPYGLSIVVPAQAGPYDLGTVVVRAKVDVDLHTAALRISSDPLPSILHGIPLQLRSVRVAIDKPGFMHNPTSCAPRAVAATVAAAGGASARVSSRYQASGCGSLRYTPRLTVKVGGKGRVGPERPTPLVATLKQPPAQAASRGVELRLPRALSARLEVVARACAQAEYDAGRCGDAARIGSATADTPLLPNRLAGPAYFVRNPARRLPDIVVQLRGDVAFDLVGRIRITRDFRLVTHFDAIPDVPLARFQLKLPAANSPVASVAGLCRKPARLARARQTLRAQNGAVIRTAPRLKIAGCARRAR